MVHKFVLLPWVRPGDTALLREGLAGALSTPCSKLLLCGGIAVPLPARWTGTVMRVPSAHLWLCVPKDSQMFLGPASFCHMLQTEAALPAHPWANAKGAWGSGQEGESLGGRGDKGRRSCRVYFPLVIPPRPLQLYWGITDKQTFHLFKVYYVKIGIPHEKHSKGNNRQMKRQPMEWEKISTNQISDKELITKIYKELLQLNSKQSINRLKNGWRIWVDILLKETTYKWPTHVQKGAWQVLDIFILSFKWRNFLCIFLQGIKETGDDKQVSSKKHRLPLLQTASQCKGEGRVGMDLL